jgi:Uma2 family endonuclease
MLEITKRLLEDPTLGLIEKEIYDFLEKERRLREKFYEEVDENQKAEFINGKVIMHSPVSKCHNEIGRRLLHIIEQHVSTFGLGFVGYEKLMSEFTRNSYEPDIVFFYDKKAQSFLEDQNIFPIPDFVIEIQSKKTARIDRTVKYKDYEAHGVGEYWIIAPRKKEIEQFILKEGSFSLQNIYKSGIIKSDVIYGLQFDVEVVFNRIQYEKYIRKEADDLIDAKKTIGERDKVIEERDKVIEERDNVLSEEKKKSEEERRQKEEERRQKEEKENQIRSLVKLLKLNGVADEVIARQTNLSIEEIQSI